jgi:hypothetical protein
MHAGLIRGFDFNSYKLYILISMEEVFKYHWYKRSNTCAELGGFVEPHWKSQELAGGSKAIKAILRPIVGHVAT